MVIALVGAQVEHFEPGGWGAFPAVAVHPENRSLLLAGADVGGMFVSTNGGESWSVCNGDLQTGFILDIAFERTDTDNGKSVWLPLLGTSHGVYRATHATDGPCAYTFVLSSTGMLAVNSTKSMHTDAEEFAHPIASLFFERNHRLLFALLGITKDAGPAKQRGGDPFSVYISRDGGRNWEGILHFHDPIALFQVSSNGLSIFIASDRGLYSSPCDANHCGSTWYEIGVNPILVSTDLGHTWRPDYTSDTSAPCTEGADTDGIASFSNDVRDNGNTTGKCLPITKQVNATHPNLRAVSADGDRVLITAW
jgi:hypothetical protein